MPIIGSVGAPSPIFIITLADARDVQPDADVTVKLYEPGIRSVTVALVPVPVMAPGLIVQIPVGGRPLSMTLPVKAVHEDGWVIAPIAGAAGVPGGDIVTTSVEESDIHPAALVTLKL